MIANVDCLGLMPGNEPRHDEGALKRVYYHRCGAGVCPSCEGLGYGTDISVCPICGADGEIDGRTVRYTCGTTVSFCTWPNHPDERIRRATVPFMIECDKGHTNEALAATPDDTI